jgi:hypothetical protein
MTNSIVIVVVVKEVARHLKLVEIRVAKTTQENEGKDGDISIEYATTDGLLEKSWRPCNERWASGLALWMLFEALNNRGVVSEVVTGDARVTRIDLGTVDMQQVSRLRNIAL